MATEIRPNQVTSQLYCEAGNPVICPAQFGPHCHLFSRLKNVIISLQALSD